MPKFRNTLFWKNYKKFDKVIGNSSMRCTTDAIIYWKLFQKYNFSNILEIGFYQGLTAGLMIETTGALNSYTGIDPDLKTELFFSIYCNYLDKVTLHNIPSKDFNTDKKYDFILVDGDHSYEYALSDLLMAEKLLTEDGVLAIDDYNLSSDMTQAINEFKKISNLVPFLQAEQTEFWHYPANNRADFLDNLLTDNISNFIFMYNIENNQVLKAKTLNVFTNEIDLFDQVLDFYNV